MSLKKRYLEKAQHLIHKPKRPLKLQASVEPFMYHAPGNKKGLDPRVLSYDRSVSDPTQSRPTQSNLVRNAVPYSATNQRDWLTAEVDSDICSLHGQACDSSPRAKAFQLPNSLHTTTTPSRNNEDYPSFPPGDLTEYSLHMPSHYVSPSGTHHNMSVCSYPLSSTPARNIQSTGRLDSFTQNSEKEVENLEEKLKVQSNINRELKRLLVAAVGSDLQLRLNQIVSEKAMLSHRLDTSLKQLAEGGEDLDRISIECDIWRSKYLASRLMIDELASWKAELSLQYKESQKALLSLLKEQKALSRALTECISNLTKSGESFHGSNHTSSKGQQYELHKTVLDLANDAVAMSQTLSDQFSGTGGVTVSHPTRPREVHGIHTRFSEPTTGEKLAKKALQAHSRRSREQSLPLPLALSDKELSSSHTHSGLLRTDTSTAAIAFHCSKCRGRIMAV